jgi:hypothetical protein
MRYKHFNNVCVYVSVNLLSLEAHSETHIIRPLYYEFLGFLAVLNCSCTFDVRWILGSRSQWPRGLLRRSAAARLLKLWVRVPPGAWISLSCECLCCQVKVSATILSLLQWNPTKCYALVQQLLQWKSNEYCTIYVCICSLMYPA